MDTDEQNYSQKRFIRVFGALGESVCDIAATMIDFTRLEIRSNTEGVKYEHERQSFLKSHF